MFSLAKAWASSSSSDCQTEKVGKVEVRTVWVGEGNPSKTEKEDSYQSKITNFKPGGGLKNQNKQTTKTSGVKAWIASEHVTNVERKGK